MTKFNDTPRMLLSQVRMGDYAHPGEEEAIDLLMKAVAESLPKSSSLKVLDVGCGLGGTAQYIKNKLNAEVIGVDKDALAIAHAQTAYPDIAFYESDVLTVSNIFPHETFQLIYFFNVLYGIQDKRRCLQELAKLAQPNAVLAIFDYSVKSNTDFVMQDLADKAMLPINMHELPVLFDETGWKMVNAIDLTEEYIRWYREFLRRLSYMQQDLLKTFSEKSYHKVYETFNQLLLQLQEGSLGGALVIGVRNDPMIGCS